MKKKFKITLIIFIIAMFLSIFLNVFFSFLYRYKGKTIENNWSKDDIFDITYIKTIQKKDNKDFVILNLADIQLSDLGDLFNQKIIHDEIDYLVEQSNPDLITLTGDQTWSNENLISLKLLIKWLDAYKIPYAPIFGNHDLGNDYNSAVASVNKCCDLYEKGKYCLFSRGPSNLGCLGNYVINIMNGNTIIKTLYMLDAGYLDEITDEQIEWFKWNAEGIKNYSGSYSSGMVFIHKPLPEYRDAYYDYLRGDCENINNVYCYCALSGVYQSGFFECIKNYNITDVVCGHQHTNNFTLLYQDIRLTFALKTGELSFYYDDGEVNLNGATVFTLSDDVIISNINVDSNQFHIKNSENIYY